MNTGPLTETRENLSEILEQVVSSGQEYVITKHGRNVAVLLSYDEYEALIESLTSFLTTRQWRPSRSRGGTSLLGRLVRGMPNWTPRALKDLEDVSEQMLPKVLDVAERLDAEPALGPS